MFQPRMVEKAKKNRHTATNTGPDLPPNAAANAVCARLVLSIPYGITPALSGPSGV